ncbi:MAG: ABC transporter ATP-binding protein [Armatimonadetes bacterium]|nr:ABC transporter ATP-binding protein [Armatimonadota bacterium]MDE2207610.1 ABC transporter ATP-binding protein [Armatimonadota bacterium]
MIECRQLSRQFDGLLAVDELTLTVPGGELFGFLGPNGAGKTTSIKLMTGLLRPTGGSARICGFDIQTQPIEARRTFGYVPDNPFLYEKLTGIEFLQFMADLYSVDARARSARIPELLELFELGSKARQLIGSYSRGMRQKIAFAGALIHAPRVLFLDEPTVGLDPDGARTMREVLKSLCRDGCAVFISTHILEIAEKICNRIGIIHRGRLIALGTVAEVCCESGSLEEVFLARTGSSGQGAGLTRLETECIS